MVENSKSLGQILLAQGAITEEQLKDALKRQQTRASSTRLGDILVSFGYITPQHLAEALATQLNLPLVNLANLEISQELIDFVQPSVAKIYHVIPVRKENKTLYVAMSDPTNLGVVDNLRLLLECDISPVLATAEDIKEAIRKYYGLEEVTVDTMLSQVSGDSLSTVSSLSVSSLSVESIEFDGSIMEGGDDEDSDEGPVIKLVTLLILEAFRHRASDIHIEPFERELKVRYRIDGICHEVNPPPKALQNSILSRLKIMAGMDISEKRIPQDGRIKLQLMGKDIDLRASALPAIHGESFVLRILDKSSLALDLRDLGYAPDLLRQWEKLLHIPTGIVLVTGPTGSGKTTTLYASLNTINTPERKIITIENPVEYVLSGINQVQIDDDIGLSFAAGLRSILRQSPDIVMVGEVRDSETAEIAIRAALTGHLVFSTLHTNDAAGALTRLVDMGIKPFLAASSIQAVSAQRLVRKICRSCKVEDHPTDDQLRQVGLEPDEVRDITFHKGTGCENCNRTGYHGRTTVLELLMMNQTIRDMVLRHEPTINLKNQARRMGMRTLRDDAWIKVFAGMTTIEEAVAVTQLDDPLPGVKLVKSVS
ncbi:MAG: Flp pilus assembly complex ATPase component TadA [Candidatus Hydrogenedentota bacterium]|nr:MAG: Flp pilus assembly complex ATPase component TadA [Candidatus Hydrogenedentota bacterium]